MPSAHQGAGRSTPAEANDPLQKTLSTERLFSGESERIGMGNWDDPSPFGKHVGYL
jgi:hypothetical protein